MAAIDFTRSLYDLVGSMSRIQLEAACTIFDEASGAEDTYYLIATCRAEHTHSDDKLTVMPNYDFRGIFGGKGTSSSAPTGSPSPTTSMTPN
jgi:hypothetical protein